MSEPASDAIVALNTAIHKAAGDYAARCGNSEGAWDMHFFPLHNAAVAALAAAREEGRRECEKLRREEMDLHDRQEAKLHAAHAAQLVAMREATVLAVLVWFMRRIRPAIEVVLPEALVKLPTPELAVTQFRAYEERNGMAPLPDAEDALADAVRDTRIDTVRWCHANPVESSQAHEVESPDQYVARALNALESKP